MLTLETLKTNESSATALSAIFSPENAIACANYGGGSHCNEARNAAKLKIWGKRGDENPENSCMVAKIIYVDGKPAGLFNIGKSGTPPTALNKIGTEVGFVYEFSGLVVVDEFLKSELQNISSILHDFMHTCAVDTGYTKAIVTFATDHPYQKEFLLAAGGVEITQANIEKALGANSTHPERFTFEGEQFQECSKWAPAGTEKIVHDGWHDSEPCLEWTAKTAMVFDVDNGLISSFGMEL